MSYLLKTLIIAGVYLKRTPIIYRRFTHLPVVMYGCETWSLTLRDEHRLRVSENGMLRKIYGPEMEEDGSC
jgi:hypothetical protein